MRSVFCGREREFAYLREAWRSVAVGGAPRLEVLVGESGVGESRLVQKFYGRMILTLIPPGGRHL